MELDTFDLFSNTKDDDEEGNPLWFQRRISRRDVSAQYFENFLKAFSKQHAALKGSEFPFIRSY